MEETPNLFVVVRGSVTLLIIGGALWLLLGGGWNAATGNGYVDGTTDKCASAYDSVVANPDTESVMRAVTANGECWDPTLSQTARELGY